MAWPAFPLEALSGPGRAPDVLTVFTDGRAGADVLLEPQPSFNRTLSISIPWDAEVSSASLRLGAVGRSVTRAASPSAQELAGGALRNLSLEGDTLRLSHGSWGWNQTGAGLGLDCELAGGELDGAFRISHSNPALSASGGGVWTRREKLSVSEVGGLARTNETADVHITFPSQEVVNPFRELRLTDDAGQEVPVTVHDASYSNNYCTGAGVLFAVPSLGSLASSDFHLYFGNPLAERPSYGSLAFLADTFTGPAPGSSWTVSNADGLSYSLAGSLRVQGTASSEFWQRARFEHSQTLPGSFDIRFTLRPGAASGSGFFGLLSAFQDSQNSVNLGIQYDAGVGQLSPAKFILGRTVSGASSIDYAADAGSPGTAHALRGVYSSGTFTAYVDGSLLGSVGIMLSRPRISLSAAARAVGDTVDVAFDELTVSTGYALLSAKDPALSVVAASDEAAGYASSATMSSPLLENAGLLPLGTVRMEIELPPETCCTLSILGPDNQTLAEGLVNAQPVTLAPADHPRFRLRAVLTTLDPARSPRLLAWGLGDRWTADLNNPDEYSSLSNLTLSASGVSLSRSPERWSKSAGAALNPGITSTFDDMGVSHPCVLHAEGGYRMYYAGYDGLRWRIGLATSADGTTWTRYPDNPVLVPGGGWESSQLDWPFVVYNGSGYQMWYAGSSDNGATFSIGYAWSEDGFSWTRDGSNPVHKPSAGQWDSASVFAPRVLFDREGLYTMWYAGKNATATAVGRLTSNDAAGWSGSGPGPVLAPAAGGWSSLGVVPGGVRVESDGTYLMWYTGYNSTAMGVGLAISSDGSSWNRPNPNPILSNGTGSAFDKSGAGYPSVLFGAQTGLWYSAFDGSRWRIGQARPVQFGEGSALSKPVDLGTAPASIRLQAATAYPANTSVTVEARSSPGSSSWSTWTSLGQSPVSIPAGRYLQWRTILRSSANFSTPLVQMASADLAYHFGTGEAELSPISLLPSQDLTSASAAASSGGGTVDVLASTDNGTSWLSVPPGAPVNLSGRALRLKAVLSGNYTASPDLAGLSYSYSFRSYPSDCQLDVGGDGTPEWSIAGLFTGTANLGDLAGPLNKYLDARRNDTGDARIIPLSFSSSTSSIINADGLRVDWSKKSFPNHPPTIASQPIERARVNELYIYDVDGRDPDRRDRLSYTLAEGPGAMAISDPTGEMTWMPAAIDVGYHAVRVVVSDGQEAAEQSFTLVVSNSPVNNPPRLAGSPPDRGTVGYEYCTTFSAPDPDNDRVRFSLPRGTPAGAGIDEQSGRFSWIPAPGQTGFLDFEVLGSDSLDTAHLRFRVNVTAEGANSLPTVTSVPPRFARLNLPFSYRVVATDPDNDSLSFTLVSGPANATLSPEGTLSWTPAPSELGAVAFAIRVSDGKGYIVHNFTLSVLLENRAPAFENIPISTKLASGSEWTFGPLVSDADGDPLYFSLLDFPNGMTVNLTTGVLRWTPSASQKGRFTVSLAASDGNSTSILNFTLNVEGATPEKGILEQYGLMLTILVIGLSAAGGAAAVLIRRRRRPAEVAEPSPEPKPAEESAPGELFDKRSDSSGEMVLKIVSRPKEEERPAGAAPGLPPPEPAQAGVAEPMKQVGSISRELSEAAAATSPPPSALEAPPLPRPPLEPPAAPPPPPAEPDRDGEGETTKVAAPPPAPTLTPPPAVRPATPPAKAPAAAVSAEARAPELYKPIPGPYDERRYSLEAEPAQPAERPAYPGTGQETKPTSEASLGETLGSGTPAAPAGGSGEAGLSQDMDFLRSFLTDKKGDKEERVVEKSAEWGMLKQFTRELEADHTTKRAPGPPASASQPAPPAPATPPERKEEPRKGGSSLSLDDILDELEK